MIQTNLLDKFCSFHISSLHTPQQIYGNSFSNIYAKIVGVYVGEPRKTKRTPNSSEITSRVMLLVQLMTFAKDSLAEVPIEVVMMHESEAEAKGNCTVE